MMFRAVTILLVTIALALGSLGLPVYLHACEMIGAEVMSEECPMCTPKPACGACAEAQAKQGDRGHSMTIKAKPCCTEHNLVQKTDPTVVVHGMSIPLPVVLMWSTATYSYDDALTTAVPVVGTHDRSPPLAMRASSTYLFNSTFLI